MRTNTYKDLIKKNVRTVPDYPVQGVNFYDVNSLFSSDLWVPLVKEMADEMNHIHPTHIIGIESRGFVYGLSLIHI